MTIRFKNRRSITSYSVSQKKIVYVILKNPYVKLKELQKVKSNLIINALITKLIIDEFNNMQLKNTNVSIFLRRKDILKYCFERYSKVWKPDKRLISYIEILKDENK